MTRCRYANGVCRSLGGLGDFWRRFDLGVGARLGSGHRLTVHYGWTLVSDSHSRHCQILMFWATRLDFTFGNLQSCFFLCVIQGFYDSRVLGF